MSKVFHHDYVSVIRVHMVVQVLFSLSLSLTARLLSNVICHSTAHLIRKSLSYRYPVPLMWRNSDPQQSSQPLCHGIQSPFNASSPEFLHSSDQPHISSKVPLLHQACRAMGIEVHSQDIFAWISWVAGQNWRYKQKGETFFNYIMC